ncbi:MAG: Na/Pi cotransporter family protein [Oscillospiraceae bacterium]
MDIFGILSLLGGLAMFLFGMNLMGQALEKSAGNRLKGILSRLTDKPIKGLLLGAGVTAVIQSSSATTVMVVGFVNSGLMKLSQATGVIMGANIGTTITAWLLSLTGLEGDNLVVQLLKPSSFTPVLAVIGVILYMFIKQEKKKDIGVVLLGFSILMFGMEAMSGAVKPLASVPAFTNILLMFSNPILGVLAGALLTGIIQSSSASVGILQALAVTGSVTIGSAIPIIMGQNIGTCITALISSVGTNKNARRTALIHLYFNIIGTIFCLVAFYSLNAVVHFAFLTNSINAFGIAVIHTSFNVLCTILLFPFTKQLERLACRTIPDAPKEEQTAVSVLDPRLMSMPTIAVERCREIAGEMALLVQENILLSITLLGSYSEETARQVEQMEEQTDHYEDQLGTYLVTLSTKDLSDEDDRQVSKLLRCINDFERISDHALNISESAKELYDKQFSFSEKAYGELQVVTDALIEIVHLAVTAFVNDDLETALSVEPLEEVIDDLQIMLKNEHVRRLQTGACTVEIGFVFNDLLTNFERVSDHCSNIAVCQIEMSHDRFDIHAYLDSIKTGGNPAFVEKFKAYSEKYAIAE